MPLFRTQGKGGGKARAQSRRRKTCSVEWMRGRGRTDEDGSVLSLTRLCLLSLADNMKDVWVKDYADKYLDHYTFRHIMGPFNVMPGDLVEELTMLLCTRKKLSRAALHLLLVPQLRGLSLEKCPGLATSALCAHIAARCQGLWSLDLSGAQQLPSKVLSETLDCLPALRSLSLAGTPCDTCVIRVIAHRCPFLRHLDVSRCHFLSPAELLPLGGGAFFQSSASPSRVSPSTSKSFCPPPLPTPTPPLPLSTLLALDIGFGEQEGEPVAAAAYLLLSLPRLETVAMEGLAQACRLIQCREFDQTNEFADRKGVPRLVEVWGERRHCQDQDSWRTKRLKIEEASTDDEEEEGEEEEGMCWERCVDETEEDAREGEGASFSQNHNEDKKRDFPQPREAESILHLKDVRGLSCESLDSLGHLCPDICSISLIADDEEPRGRNKGDLLAEGLQMFSGQLQSLSVLYPGPLSELFVALQAVGSSLVSLTLEGVKTGANTPLVVIMKACPRLRELLISAEPPSMPQMENLRNFQQDDGDLPALPHLSSLSLKFSYDDSKVKPHMFWISLCRTLHCLLTGSLSLQRLSLVALPCTLNTVLMSVLNMGGFLFRRRADTAAMPLGQVQHVDLSRTDVKIRTVRSLMLRSSRLKCLDLSKCWQITEHEVLTSVMMGQVKVIWAT